MTTLLRNKFDYSILEGTKKGTEERGIAVLRMVLNFCSRTITDALEINLRAVRDGKCESGLLPSVLFEGCLMMAEMSDESMVPLMEGAEEQILEGCLTHLMDQGLIIGNEDGTISGNWTPSEEEDEVDEEFREQILDGVSYPNVTFISPDKVQFFARNEKMFFELFPTGNYEMVKTTARHLKEGRLNVIEHREKFLYSVR